MLVCLRQEFNLFKVLGNYGASAIFGRKNTRSTSFRAPLRFRRYAPQVI